MKDWLLLLLRLAAGIGCAYWSGHGKVFVEETREAFAVLLGDAGLPAPYYMVLLFGVTEFFASLFLAAGFFTRKAAALLLIVGAAWAAIQWFHLGTSVGNYFSFTRDAGLGTGYLLLAYLILLLVGPGNISFDGGRRRSQEG